MTVAQLPLWANKQINKKNKNKTNKNEKKNKNKTNKNEKKTKQKKKKQAIV